MIYSSINYGIHWIGINYRNVNVQCTCTNTDNFEWLIIESCITLYFWWMKKIHIVIKKQLIIQPTHTQTQIYIHTNWHSLTKRKKKRAHDSLKPRCHTLAMERDYTEPVFWENYGQLYTTIEYSDFNMHYIRIIYICIYNSMNLKIN